MVFRPLVTDKWTRGLHWIVRNVGEPSKGMDRTRMVVVLAGSYMRAQDMVVKREERERERGGYLKCVPQLAPLPFMASPRIKRNETQSCRRNAVSSSLPLPL